MQHFGKKKISYHATFELADDITPDLFLSEPSPHSMQHTPRTKYHFTENQRKQEKIKGNERKQTLPFQ